VMAYGGERRLKEHLARHRLAWDGRLLSTLDDDSSTIWAWAMGKRKEVQRLEARAQSTHSESAFCPTVLRRLSGCLSL
jgi:hypothetical protein